MDQIVTFNKSFQQRLLEYHKIFEGCTLLTYPQIEVEWSNYLEFQLDPSGWQAIWKIPRVKCETLKIPFPSVVLVYVMDVQYANLTALVKVLSTQDDICIPDKHYVNLSELWATKEQDKSIGLNLHKTADVLDQFRVFFIHLLMPWDRDMDENVDWRFKYLESRLRLHYDLKNGLIPKITAGQIYSLINEAKRLQTKRDLLEEQIDEEDNHLEVLNSSKIVTSDKNAEILLEMYVRMTEIKNEMELLEDPVSRSVIIKRNESLVPREDVNGRHVWLVFNKGMTDEYLNFLQRVQIFYPKEELTFVSDLQAKMETTTTQDVFILKSSKHTIKGEGAIIENWTIQGIESPEATTIVSHVSDVMLDFVGETAVIQNISIDAKSAQCAILVRKGKVVLRNCKIFGDGLSSIWQGIIVLAGAEIHIESCDISGFAVGIVGNSNATIKLQNSCIHDTIVGLKLYDDCVVTAEKTTFQNCKDFGIVIETEKDTFEEKNKVTSFETLNIIPDVKTKSVTGQNNVKGDVIIKNTFLKAKEDLFSDPDLDPTIIEIDDSLIELSDDSYKMDTADNSFKTELKVNESSTPETEREECESAS